MNAEVSYYVRATILRERRVMTSITQTVALYDSLEVAPPLCTTDFPSEYVLENGANLKKGLLSTYGTINASACQPLAFEFDNARESVVSQMQLTLTVHNSGELLDAALLSSTHAEITWRLITRTFLSAEPLERMPTTASAKFSPVTWAASLGPARHTKIRFLDWRRQRKEEICWEATEVLWLTMPKRPLHAPTFSTALVSRRYSIAMNLRLQGTGRGKLSLCLPCQIIYRRSPSDAFAVGFSGNRPGVSMPEDEMDTDFQTSEDLRLPMYCP